MKGIEEGGAVLSSVSAEYSEDDDDCSESDLGQTLRVSTHDAGSGPYYVLESERWAFDSIAEVTKHLLDFAARAGMDVKAEKTKLAELLCSDEAPIERETNKD
jgi:hypothetical protein